MRDDRCSMMMDERGRHSEVSSQRSEGRGRRKKDDGRGKMDDGKRGERRGTREEGRRTTWKRGANGKERGHILNIKYSHKGASVKQVQKRFNPDEIKATKISLGRQGRQRRKERHFCILI